ncbi:MAG: ChaN family lipoprotein [Candidatus Krumholzibacteriia bacterium]
MAERAFQTEVGASPPAIRRAVLRLRRSVHRRMQEEVRAYTGGNSPALERYYREYMREFRRLHALASYGELFQSLLETDLLFVGDYHTLRQSQEVASRLLERAAADERPLILALEMILEEHQEHLDAYMHGEIGDEEFLERIEYRSTWNFNWENYRPLFDTARQLQVRVVGINHPARGGRRRIRERDDRIAESLVSIIQNEPQARLMVLIGDLHLASNHLPRALERHLDSIGLPRRRLIVFQNSDTLYWTLAERGDGEDTQVVRLGPDRFCVMEVPPYVKLQSYLSWEQAVDRSEDPGEREEIVLEPPAGASVLDTLVRQLSQFLDMPAADAGCDLFTNLEEHFFELIENTAELDDARVHEIHLHAFANRSCFVPELNLVYLPYFSVNHATEEAMHVLQWRHGARQSMTGDAYEDFYVRTMHHALGFFASKLVNPRRVPTTEEEFRTFQRSASRRLHEPQLAFRKLVARFVVQHKDHEQAQGDGPRGRLKQIYEQDLDILLEITLSLGYMLGDELAAALQDGTLGREQLRELVLPEEHDSAAARYFRTLDLLRS